MDRILLSPPHLTGEELRFLADALDSGWLTPLGPEVDAFEAEVRESTGVEAALAVCSGTAALHLALRVLGVGAGDRVVCSTFTFIGSVTPVLFQGAEPVFVDSERESWNMCPGLLEDALAAGARGGRLPSAVIVTDLFGQCADYDRIRGVCARYQVPIVEDAAESLGAIYKGQAAGSLGDLGAFSFNGNKIITTSGGGMLLSSDAARIETARFLSTQARDPAPHYQHTTYGYNYRMSNLLAGVGRAQLRSLAGRVETRRRNFAVYRDRLGPLPGIEFMPEPDYSVSSRWLTTLTVDPRGSGVDRESLRLALEEQGIEARPVWKPMHTQPVFAGAGCYGGRTAETLFENGLCLPSGSALTERQLDFVCTAIEEHFERPA